MYNLSISQLCAKVKIDEKFFGKKTKGWRIVFMIFDINNIIMDRGYSFPVYIYIADCGNVCCKAISNLHFSHLHSRGLELPLIKGRPDCKILGITFSDCTFEKVSFEKNNDGKHHGAIMYDEYRFRSPETRNAEVCFNNTKFITEE